MGDTGQTQWSSDEEKVLRHEALIAEVIRVRDENRPEKFASPTFISILGTSGFTAFITVILGGVIGQLIISSAQTSRARTERNIAEYTQHLKNQQDTVSAAYGLIGKVFHASDTKISLTKGENSLDSVIEEDRELRKKEIIERQKKADAAIDEWDLEHERLGLLIRYYNPGQTEVLEAWRDTEECVDQYINCALECERMKFINQSITDGKYNQCKTMKETARKSMNVMASILDDTRQYSWQLIDDPVQATLALRNKKKTIITPLCKK
jgi:hypothetical protein